MPPLPSKLTIPFGSLLQYSTKREPGLSEMSVQSREVMKAIKNHSSYRGHRAIERAVGHLVTDLQGPAILAACFPPETLLVPVPGHAPLVDGALWVAAETCRLLMAAGVASDGDPLLRRSRKVPKSAFSAPGERPSPQEHYDSIDLDRGLLLAAPSHITLVDDVITRGSTMIAAYQLLREAYPTTPIVAFGLLRAMSGVEVASIVEPVIGTITYDHGVPQRRP